MNIFSAPALPRSRRSGVLLCLSTCLAFAANACRSGDDSNGAEDASTDSEGDSAGASDAVGGASAGSGGVPTSGGAPNGGTSSTGGSNAAGGAEACGTAGLILPDPISQTTITSPLPEPSGGSIRPGRYVLSEWRTSEPSPPPNTFAAVFELDDDGTGRGVQQRDSDSAPFAFAMTWGERNGYLVLTYTCPEDKKGPSEGRPYSVNGSTLEFTTDNDTLLVYSRVP